MLTQSKDFTIDTKWHINSLFGMSDQHTLSEWSGHYTEFHFWKTLTNFLFIAGSLSNQMAIPFFVWNNIVIIAWCSVGSVCVVQRLDHCRLGILSPKSGITYILLKFLCISLYYLLLETADSISLFVKISSSLISEFSKIGCRIGISFLNNMEHILAHSSKRMISLLNQMVIRFLYEIIL